MQIKAAVLRDPNGRYEVEDVEIDAPGPGQVLVRVVGAGMCHTDVLPRGAASMSPPATVQ